MKYNPQMKRVNRALETLQVKGYYRVTPLLRYRKTMVALIVLGLAPLLMSALVLVAGASRPDTSTSALLIWILLVIGLLSWLLYNTLNSMRSPRTLHLNSEGFWYTAGDRPLLSLIRWHEIEQIQCQRLTRRPDGSPRPPRAQARYELSVVLGCSRTLQQIAQDPVVLKQPDWRRAKDIALFNVGLPRTVSSICELMRQTRQRYTSADVRVGYTDPSVDRRPD